MPCLKTGQVGYVVTWGSRYEGELDRYVAVPWRVEPCLVLRVEGDRVCIVLIDDEGFPIPSPAEPDGDGYSVELETAAVFLSRDAALREAALRNLGDDS